MRYAPAAALIALAALIGQASAQNQPVPQSPPKEIIESTPPSSTPAAPKEAAQPDKAAQQHAPAQPSEPQPEAAPKAAAPAAAQQPARAESTPAAPQQGNALAGPEQQQQGERAVQSKSGQGGKQEPGTVTPSRDDKAVLVDGKWNVPGAPVDSQTVPAKFSEGNAALDKRPIMALPLALSEEQKQKLVAAIRAADVKNAEINPKLTEELPVTVQLHEMPLSANEMGVGNYKYVRLSDRILLVTPENRIVVAEIKG